jgi:hypothetical protein
LAAGFYFFPMPDRSGIGLWIETPPSTPSTWPVTCFDMDEAKKTTALAMSSGLPRRRGRTEVLDRARTFAPRPHDLHRGGPRGGLHGAHVSHAGSLRPDPSVQIPPEPQTKPQLNEPRLRQHPKREPSRVIGRRRRATDGGLSHFARRASPTSCQAGIEGEFELIYSDQTALSIAPVFPDSAAADVRPRRWADDLAVVDNGVIAVPRGFRSPG